MAVPPPSKPDRRISRIRLSSRWFTSERIDRSEPERCGEIAPAQPRPPQWPCTLAGVVNMSSKSIAGLRPVTLATMVPGGTARRHSHRCRLLRFSHSSSTFLRSLRSMAVTPLPRYYGRSDSCPPDSWTLRRNACSPLWTGLPDSRTRPSSHSVSKHLRMLRLVQSGRVTPSTGQTERASLWELGASPLLRRLATPRRPNRVQFPLLLERLLTD